MPAQGLQLTVLSTSDNTPDSIPVGFHSDPTAVTGALGTVAQPASRRVSSPPAPCGCSTALEPHAHPSALDPPCRRCRLWSHPCPPHDPVAELLIPTTDSSVVALGRRGSVVWGATKRGRINSVCHSQVLGCAEPTAPHHRKVQIKKRASELI